MKTKIRMKRLNGRLLTRAEVDYVKQHMLGPKFCAGCGICDFNLDLHLGLIKIPRQLKEYKSNGKITV